jgi:phosphotransferase system HPr (HPr) family protein
MQENCEAVVTLTGDLHARPAASLAIAAAMFESQIALRVGDRRADAKSVLSVMGIGASSGQQVRVQAEGPDAAQAVEALSELLAQATQVGA